MRWTERQRAMLAEMGIRLPPGATRPDDDSLPAAAGRGVDRRDTDSAAASPVPTGDADVASFADLAARDAAPETATVTSPGAILIAAPVATSGAGPVATLVATSGATPVAAPGAPVVGVAFGRGVGSVPAVPARVAVDPLPEGRAAAIATLAWPALREAVAGCTACRLCETRRQTVFGVGHPQAHWMVVGEAPGEQEDIQGEPFVGKSGQLLDNMLRALGLSRHESTPAGADSGADPARQVYIANTLKCRPPGNRNPEPEELARCEPFLMRQLELVKPRIVLAMGRFAVQSLLRSTEPVGRLRGRVHAYRGVPLVVTYHPAYLLRNPEDKARAWDDLCLAREAAAGATPT